VNAIAFTERFARGTHDDVWLAQVRDRDWLLFTRDDRWHYHRAELLALIAARARAFIFTSQGSAEEIAHSVWRALPKIAELADANTPAAPFIYKVTQAGVDIVFPSPKFRFPLPR
jgi:PIN like domain